jgi:tRNA A37 threonylcarbamoyladenosine synthetase subunit TsaC/SUA5/YrdC
MAALLCSAVIVGGCSYTAMPKNVPTMTGTETMSLSGVSVIVTNAEKDTTEYKILTDGKDDSGFRANREAWSRKLVETLARELARRGAVRSNAPVKLSIALPEITFIESKTEYQFKVKVVVSSSKGGQKRMRALLERAGTGLRLWRLRPINWPVKR